jgi:hypothetical protein
MDCKYFLKNIRGIEIVLNLADPVERTSQVDPADVAVVASYLTCERVMSESGMPLFGGWATAVTMNCTIADEIVVTIQLHSGLKYWRSWVTPEGNMIIRPGLYDVLSIHSPKLFSVMR